MLAICALGVMCTPLRGDGGGPDGLLPNPYLEHPPVVDDVSLGSSASVPGGLVVIVDDEDPLAGWFGGIGRLADAALFAGPDYPWLRLTVVFSCARPDLLSGRGNYANPRSVWYNSFFGFYRIDV